jgi:hypothetical protein
VQGLSLHGNQVSVCNKEVDSLADAQQINRPPSSATEISQIAAQRVTDIPRTQCDNIDWTNESKRSLTSERQPNYKAISWRASESKPSEIDCKNALDLPLKPKKAPKIPRKSLTDKYLTSSTFRSTDLAGNSRQIHHSKRLSEIGGWIGGGGV